jgi:hypothetical protein
MEKFFEHFGVIPDYIWLVDKRIRGERITNYNLALNFAHKRYHAYYNVYKQRKTEYQIAVMTAFDLALPLRLPGEEEKEKINLSVCNETFCITLSKSKQQIYQKTAMLVNKCYYKYLKKYYGEKDWKEIIVMVMIELSIKKLKMKGKLMMNR